MSAMQKYLAEKYGAGECSCRDSLALTLSSSHHVSFVSDRLITAFTRQTRPFRRRCPRKEKNTAARSEKRNRKSAASSARFSSDLFAKS